MRSINFRFILITLGLVALLGVGATILQQIQVRRSASILLEQAKQRIEAGQPREALSFLTRYTTLAPHNAEAQIMLADSLAEVGAVPQAIKWYEQALLRDASQHAARRRLVELCVSNRRFSAAKSHLIDYLLPYSPNDAQLYFLLGVCHQGLGEFDSAIQQQDEAISRNPALIEAYSRKAAIHRDQQRDPGKADTAMNALVTANETSAAAYLARADYRTKYRTTESAAKDIEDAVRLAPDDIDIIYLAAKSQLDLAGNEKDPEALLSKAEGLLEGGMKEHPHFAGWYLGLARADRARGDLDKAIAHVEDGLAILPNHGDLQWNYADMLIQLDRVGDGLAVVATLRQQQYPNVPLVYLEALADVRSNKFVEAAKDFNAIRGQMDAWPELARQSEYWLGVCYERLGEYGLQLAAFRSAARIDPSWVPARQSLANTLARAGRIDEAITEFQDLNRASVPASVSRQLASLLVLRELQRPDEQREWTAVESFLIQAAREDAKAPDYMALTAEIQAAKNLPEAARKTLEQGVKDFPESARPRLALVALELSSDKWDAAERLIDETQSLFGDVVEVRLARMRYLVQRFGLESYDRLLELEKTEPTGDSEQQQQWRTSLAAAYFTLGKTADAERLWNLAVKAEPDNIRPRMFLFDLALRAKDDEKMSEMLRDIARIEQTEKRPLWEYGEATRLVVRFRKGDAGALEEAETHLEQVRSARPTWPRVPLLQAEIAELRGQFDQVVKHYLEAFDLGERSPAVVRRVVEVLYRQGRYVEADLVLRRFDATPLPMSGELGRLAADVSFRVQDFGRAVNIAEQSIGKSNKYEDLVWMGQLQSVLGKVTDAERKFLAAIQLRPQSSEAWIAIVQHFVRSGNPDKADLAIQTLAKSIDKDSVDYVEAVCRMALGDSAGALRKFDAAARRSDASVPVLKAAAEYFLANGRSTMGEPPLNRMIAHPDVTPNDAAWARRNLALISAAKKDTQARAKAISLLDENLRLSPNSPDDLRAKAACLQLSGEVKDAEAALSIVNELMKSQGPTPSDHLLAHQLNYKLGRLTEARKHIEELTFANTNDPQNLIRYILFIIDQDEPREVQVWIDRLQRLCTDELAKISNRNDPRRDPLRLYLAAAAGLSIQLTIIQGETSSGIDKVVRQVTAANRRDNDLTAAEAAQVMNSLARQFEPTDSTAALKLRAAAESLLRTASSPRDTVALVTELVRRDRFSEAIELWKSKFDSAAADQFAVVGAALAAQSQVKTQDIAAIADLIDALPRQQRSNAVLVSLSQVFAFQGEHAKAIAALRELLAKQPDDLATTNNLACYLALSGSNKAEALELINALIEKQGEIPALLDSRGIILLELNQPKDALRDLERSAAAEPAASTYLHLAAVHLELGNAAESAKAMVRARELDLSVNQLHPLERVRYQSLLK